MAEKTQRRSLSKTIRFEVFKRDLFTCQYCGAQPPAVILHVDHVVAVANGGNNDIDNLVTACQACNSGKGARDLSVAPLSLAERAEEIEEKAEQLKAYEALLRAQKRRETRQVNAVVKVYERTCEEGWTLNDAGRQSVRTFLRKLPLPVVLEAMEIAVTRFPSDRQPTFKYFCGICWKRIKEVPGAGSQS